MFGMFAMFDTFGHAYCAGWNSNLMKTLVKLSVIPDEILATILQSQVWAAVTKLDQRLFSLDHVVHLSNVENIGSFRIVIQPTWKVRTATNFVHVVDKHDVYKSCCHCRAYMTQLIVDKSAFVHFIQHFHRFFIDNKLSTILLPISHRGVHPSCRQFDIDLRGCPVIVRSL